MPALDTRTIPVGPAAAEATLLPDLVQLIDIEKQWPDRADCPNWPSPEMARHSNLHPGSARARLQALHQALHRGQRTRPVTAAERESLLDRYFVRTGGTGPWSQSLGFSLAPRHDREFAFCEMIIEAAWVRGHIRRQPTEADKARAEEDRRNAVRLRTVENYAATKPALEAELAGLVTAEERHKQRIEDERASRRATEIRMVLRTGYHEASSAAFVLGIDAPAEPDVGKE